MSEQQTPWWGQQSSELTIEDASGGKNVHRGALFVASTFVLIVVAMVSFLVLGPNPEDPYEGPFGSVVYPTTTRGLIAECGDIYTFTPPKEHYGALPEQFFDNPTGPGYRERRIPVHPMQVPAYGFFSTDPSITFQKDFYIEKDRDDLLQRHEYLKLMWNGYKIIWYEPGIDKTTKDAIAEFVNTHDKVVAMPWFIENKQIPRNRSIAFSAWNVTQSCGKWFTPVAETFMNFATKYNKDRNRDIHTVKLRSDGELPLIDPHHH